MREGNLAGILVLPWRSCSGAPELVQSKSTRFKLRVPVNVIRNNPETRDGLNRFPRGTRPRGRAKLALPAWSTPCVPVI